VAASNLNPANAITALRGLTLFPIWYFVSKGQGQYAFLALAAGGTMDLLDGWVAKKLDCQTAFGEVFDGLMDGVLYGSVLLVLMAYGWVPLWSSGTILGLGIFNLGCRYLYAKRVGRAVNYQSYAMECFTGNVAFLLGFAIVDFEPAYFYGVSAPVMVVIVIHDVKRMLIDPVPA
jgi:phosphatidylglycerophosphate synthase